MVDEQKPAFIAATYDEIRLRFALRGTDQAHILAKRRGWSAESRMPPGVVARIRVPQGDWNAVVVGFKASPVPDPDLPDPKQDRGLSTSNQAVAAFQDELQRPAARERALLKDLEEAKTELGIHRTRAVLAEAKLEAVEATLAQERERADRAEACQPLWRRLFRYLHNK